MQPGQITLQKHWQIQNINQSIPAMYLYVHKYIYINHHLLFATTFVYTVWHIWLKTETSKKIGF